MFFPGLRRNSHFLGFLFSKIVFTVHLGKEEKHSIIKSQSFGCRALVTMVSNVEHDVTATELRNVVR